MKTLLTTIATLGILAGSATVAFAQDELSTEPFKLAEVTCFDVVSLPESDADFVTALLIGFKTGGAGTDSLSPKGIEQIVLAFDKKCLENPDMKAIDAL